MKVNFIGSILLFFSFFIQPTCLFAQYTYVPDDNFEQALIDLGYDDVLDDYVLTANIERVTELNLMEYDGIHDLTGIEDFNELKNLLCHGVYIMNFSENINLEKLKMSYCFFHNEFMDKFDLSSNINLRTIYLFSCEFNTATMDIGGLVLDSLQLIFNSFYTNGNLGGQLDFINCNSISYLYFDSNSDLNSLSIPAQVDTVMLWQNFELEELAISFFGVL
jgi:hypothetical protein